MQNNLINIKIIILILFMSIQPVLADVPHIPRDKSESQNVQIEVENIYEGSQVGHMSDVWGKIQNVLFVSSIHEEFGYLPTNETLIYQPFDNMFYYGIEFELPTFIENIKILSAVEGEYTHFVIEKPIYSKTGIGYVVSDQLVVDCTFEAGVYDAEYSKALYLETTFSVNIF